MLSSATGTWFRIDDRNDGDVYPLFCGILVAVPAPPDNEVLLVLDNAPHNSDVLELLQEHGGRYTTDRLGSVRIKLALRAGSRGDSAFLRAFAKSIRKVVGRGQRYPDPQWKWICPRTAAALDLFADALKEFNSRQRGK